jgi:hypothetical protein
MPRRNPDTPDTPDTPEMVEGAHNPFVNALLSVAQRLADEREAVLAKVAANRETLRSLRTQNLMDQEQAASVEAFYPTRTRTVRPAVAEEGASDNAPTPVNA